MSIVREETDETSDEKHPNGSGQVMICQSCPAKNVVPIFDTSIHHVGDQLLRAVVRLQHDSNAGHIHSSVLHGAVLGIHKVRHGGHTLADLRNTPRRQDLPDTFCCKEFDLGIGVVRSLVPLRCCGCGCCRCCSCFGSCRCWLVQDDMQGVLIASSCLSFSPLSYPFVSLGDFGLTLGLCEPVSIASLFKLLAARQTLRLPLALRMLDPSSIWIHLAVLHHTMCLLDTSLSSHVGPLFSSSLFSSTHSLRSSLLSFFALPLRPYLFLAFLAPPAFSFPCHVPLNLRLQLVPSLLFTSFFLALVHELFLLLLLFPLLLAPLPFPTPLRRNPPFLP